MQYLRGYLKKEYTFDKVYYEDGLFKNVKDIKEVPITKEDIYNTIKEIDNYIEKDDIIIFGRKLTPDDKYSIFTEDKLKEYLEKSIDFIMSELNKFNQ